MISQILGTNTLNYDFKIKIRHPVTMEKPGKFRVCEPLEGPHVMVAVLYIGLNPGCNKSDLYRDISHNSSMPRKLDELERAKIIRMVPDGRGVKLYLTDTGKEIAKHLSAINDAIGRAKARKAAEAAAAAAKESQDASSGSAP